jgi:SsrA-binding protein
MQPDALYNPAMAKKKKSPGGNTICLNKRAKHEYIIESKFEAGLCLSGWEVKSLREGRGQLVDSYVVFKNDEAWLVGAHITPLITASTHFVTDPRRDRKLLLHRREIEKLTNAVQAKGYTCVALALYWKNGRVKCEIALVKGKKLHDKRADQKEKDWNRQKQREISVSVR